MKSNTRRLLVTFAVGLTLALGLVWVLSAPSSEVRAAPGDVLCVTPGGGVYPACTLVFTNVQAAVDAASGGEEIRVAAGRYTGVNNYGGLAQVVYISKTLMVRGGYTTTNGFAGPPDPTANPTTLDAQGLGRVVVISDTITPTVERLRLTGGDAAGLGGGRSGWDAGGGVYIYTATATISDCVVYSNTASTADRGDGGGLYLIASDATLSANTVQSNTASTADYGYGGGLLLYESAATLSGNTVVSNTASTGSGGAGGGLYLVLSAATLSGNTVVSNTASTADRGDGGGLYLVLSAATLSGNTVVSNTASTASWGDGGGLYLFYSDATLSANTVQGNTASTADEGSGGGLYLYYSAATLSSNTVVSNTATLSPTASGRGGGLRVRYSSPFTLTNNLVADNHANTAGSGLWFDGSSDYPTSGRLLHTTIADNRGSGQGVYVGVTTTLAFTNTIIAGHSYVGIAATAGSTVTLEATLWHDNGAIIGGGGYIVIGTVNVTGDPAFVNPSAWDYHLAAGSAAIDKGVDAGVDTDIDGEPRPAGAGYDLGADEAVCVTGATIAGPMAGIVGTTYSFTATVSPPNATLPIAYTWSPAPDSGQGTPIVQYTWTTAGTKTINVVASNCGGAGSGSDDHTITIESGTRYVYLPLVLRNFP